MDLPASATPAVVTAPASGAFSTLLRKSLSAHGIFWLVIAAYYAGFVVMMRIRPDMETAGFMLLALGFLAFSVPLMVIGLAAMRFFHIATVVKPEHPVPVLLADLKAFLTDRGRLAHGLPMVVIMTLFMYVFVQLKANVPILNPFSWDETLMSWDRALHFGTLPHDWLQPLLGFGPITFLININYNAWFAVMWMVWVYFAFDNTVSETRTRFFLTFFLAWIIGGGLMAIYFSSVGPCFYGRFGLTPDPYAGLMDYLRSVNEHYSIWAIPVQDELWQGYVGDSAIDGVSAMPSMHNGTALLFALSISKVNRKVGRVLYVHAAGIFIGSVMLAWHYAVDSYLAWALTLALWYTMGPVARWWHNSWPHRDFALAMGSRG